MHLTIILSLLVITIVCTDRAASGVGACGSALSIVVFVSDNRWCTRHEVDEARRYGIPIIVLVDTDKQLAREVIDKYMELGFSWLFDEQAR